ncbi:hypothetical protein CYMTET_5507 [Cymbomonas tetramitiformis]|uniref:Uncharacterized protein n=1 Tax=Cymbomonas tetramitiformis TaxID=36881 RepID=A0AAE0GZ10_9CHLO|nr:hypothetical protein CYMTET_5507 [Cymbomonas tetramitiformis]
MNVQFRVWSYDRNFRFVSVARYKVTKVKWIRREKTADLYHRPTLPTSLHLCKIFFSRCKDASNKCRTQLSEGISFIYTLALPSPTTWSYQTVLLRLPQDITYFLERVIGKTLKTAGDVASRHDFHLLLLAAL